MKRLILRLCTLRFTLVDTHEFYVVQSQENSACPSRTIIERRVGWSGVNDAHRPD